MVYRTAIPIILGIAFLISCTGQFSTKYERIEENKIRPLALTFDPAEAAPGDTVRVNAYFAGDSIASIAWNVVLNVYMNMMGVEVQADTVPIETLEIPGSRQYRRDPSGGTTASVAFVVPRDLIRKSKYIPDDWVSMIPSSQRNLIPEQILSLSKDTMITFIELLAAYDNQFPASMSDSSFRDALAHMLGISPDSASIQLRNAALLSQFLTVKIRFLLATITPDGYTYRTKADYVVRYNSRFTHNPYMGVNHNPRIRWVALYGVKEKPEGLFDPANSHYDTVFYLFDTRRGADSSKADTLLIDKGYHYYLAADSGKLEGIDDRDIGYSLTGETQTEFFSTEWFYQNDDPIPGADLSDLLIINNGITTGVFIPPIHTDMHHFTLWTVVYDNYFGEKDRPRGFAVREIRGVIKYTDAYMQEHR